MTPLISPAADRQRDRAFVVERVAEAEDAVADDFGAGADGGHLDVAGEQRDGQHASRVRASAIGMRRRGADRRRCRRLAAGQAVRAEERRRTRRRASAASRRSSAASRAGGAACVDPSSSASRGLGVDASVDATAEIARRRFIPAAIIASPASSTSAPMQRFAIARRSLRRRRCVRRGGSGLRG